MTSKIETLDSGYTIYKDCKCGRKNSRSYPDAEDPEEIITCNNCGTEMELDGTEVIISWGTHSYKIIPEQKQEENPEDYYE